MQAHLILLLLFAGLLAGCQKEPPANEQRATLQLNLVHEVNGAALQTGVSYTNPLGETYTVSRFKYYLSNLVLLNGNSETKLRDSYFLVDEASDSAKKIRASIPAGSYTGVRMLLGVDSARNVSGAQTGPLDPVHDMFWTWSTGYIMAKLEGSSPLSTAPNNRIQYHIGGFTGTNSALRTVQFNFPAPLNVTQTLEINLVVELQRWFDGQHNLPIAQTAVSMTPGVLSAQYANNWARMFRLQSALIP